jgi:hypothetical protein
LKKSVLLERYLSHLVVKTTIVIDKKLAILYNYLEKIKVNISNTGGNKYGKN